MNNRRLRCLFLILAFCRMGDLFAYTEPENLRVDCGERTGLLRPLHGGNSGPILYGETLDLSEFFRELDCPLLRLHDCRWPNPDVVDIHTLFPDFDADADSPESYDFRRTDDFLQSIADTGAGVVYRLGESIEHSKRKYHVHPPKDATQWTRICLGIVRHANEGWADGFHRRIRYWEIWNEPENRPAMWTGSDEDYFQLYETAARALKTHFPDLKVGGPSIGYSGRIDQGRFEPGEFLLAFLQRCRERRIPLDFFSWHLYTNDPAECVLRAKGLRRTLDEFGFAQTELHLNEWNYLPDNDWTPMGLPGQGLPRERFYERIGGAEGAAFAAGVLIHLQDSPVDVANYYSFDNQGFGLFSYHGVPKKNFYAFKAFRALLDTPLRVRAECEPGRRLAVCAGVNEARDRVGILIANSQDSIEPARLRISNLPWNGPSSYQLSVVDREHNFEVVRQGMLPEGAPEIACDSEGPSVVYISLRPDEE